ncbi:hypothetical protein AVEN_85411-1 [Araneus ventricosus]|uniref:HTH merR-type domain-containing protein n=1 Tax=Araneus ventricosus TaxID=182803 RepID=A0A4Y2FIU8_ARAVE|nr:hypothetical protein AVEN_85411-1 [Araneus ventricosus]
MARRLGTSIIEIARLVGCSRSAVVSIHAKWINDGDTSSRCQGVGRPLVIKEKGVGDCPACCTLHGVCLPTGNGISQQDNAPFHKARIVLEWFEEHTAEFHLMPWPPNSPNLNPMEHIWDVMEWQLRAQTPPCANISTLRDRCLDIWYNLSPVMNQKLLASTPRRVAAVLKAKGGATRY